MVDTDTTLNVRDIPTLTPEMSFSSYMDSIRRFPVLEPQEEYDLAMRYKYQGDEKAAHRLVTSHLRLVAKIASQYRRYGLPMADLVSEGNLGLMRAVQKFEPEKGFRLATYAMWWIKASINEFVLSQWSMVKMGSDAVQKRLFYNLRKVKANLGLYEDSDMAPEDVARIAEELNVGRDHVVNMNRRLMARDSSLNAPVSSDIETERMDMLVDENPTQEDTYASFEERTLGRQLIGEGLAALNQREREIIQARRLADDPVTLEDLGKRYGVSRERVRQIENRAFQKMQGAIKAAATRLRAPIAQGLDLLPHAV
ncbi:RNA polymerase sigma factor RpoH [Caenispirillum salinarum AK4]|uniref:RNA polymerase sigma factor n=1 Tax=Caenispirillum salinarum AK4 TaxID=1238182 RepID=K9GMG7_9PROT|nr:RNA polymerase sigma factor RpoH [Caenispirillum salinarum]EKV26282.1 RNA polymerase sigma factor RpoH [Caenispirillum salinarum AK4]